jgi:hypothetical protein
MKAPEPEHAQLPENPVNRKAPRPSRPDLVSAPQKVARALGDVVIHRPVGHQPGPVREVVGPTPQQAVELGHDVVPRSLIAGTKNPPDASLHPLIVVGLAASLPSRSKS